MLPRPGQGKGDQPTAAKYLGKVNIFWASELLIYGASKLRDRRKRLAAKVLSCKGSEVWHSSLKRIHIFSDPLSRFLSLEKIWDSKNSIFHFLVGLRFSVAGVRIVKGHRCSILGKTSLPARWRGVRCLPQITLEQAALLPWKFQQSFLCLFDRVS